MRTTTEEVVMAMASYVNTFGDMSDEFNKAMEKEHRTIQQSFSKLCFKWIEYIASNEYKTDLRNKGSQDVARALLDAFKNVVKERGFTDASLEMMSKPSGYCQMV